MKKILKSSTFMMLLLFLAVTLSGCEKEDAALSKYRSDMTEFTDTVDGLVTSIENIDLESDTRTEELLGYLDEMDAAFAEMSELEVPEQFANIEELADEASANLSEAVSLYHQAFDNSGSEESDSAILDSNVLDVALEYYSRAFKRLDYISTILQGELPEDESITIIHESEDGETESEENDTEDGVSEDEDSVG